MAPTSRTAVASPGRELLPAALFLLGAFASTTARAQEVGREPTPIARWSFDETVGARLRDASGNGHDATSRVGSSARAERIVGVVGNAIDLSGDHRLQVSGGPAFGELTELSISAWVQPTDLGGYREVFRKEDGDHRVLFSFQQGGTILSLGLNIGGYIECDAALTPSQVLDGAWHHCAGTFDGEALRVYLDGSEIGVLPRPGRILAGGGAPSFIGSLGGTSEFFQGALDELTVRAECLPPERIAGLYRAGAEALARRTEEQLRDLDGLYEPADTFAATVMGLRKALAAKGARLEREVAGVALARIETYFPQDYERFLEWSGVDLVQYLNTPGVAIDHEVAGRLVELLLEYRPLTQGQWDCLTPEETDEWRGAQSVGERYQQLRAAGLDAEYSPAWIEIVLAAGGGIDFRPSLHEAVAPYVTPHTPETRDLSAAEAEEALHRDWLHQAGPDPDAARVREEISWTRALTRRIESGGGIDLSAVRGLLDGLERDAAAATSFDRDLYFTVRWLKRWVMFANPVVDFDRILLVDMPFPGGSEWAHETRHRLGYMAMPGGRLLILDGLGPDGTLTQLAPSAPLHGSFWRPDVSHDGDKVLFCFKPHNEKAFHLYEIGADGSGLEQLTYGPYDDLDPIYLPDEEHIVFSTTRGHTYVRCMPPTNAYVLARADRDGEDIYLISRNNEPDYLPSVMNDGRIVYTRWEYTDKPLWRAQGLWTVHPDGTQTNTLWGNQSVWPDLVKDVRSIPGSHRVMFTGSAHHDWFSGSVGIIDPAGGFNFPDGITKVTADVAWPESGNGPVDPIESPDYHASGQYAAYYSPYPLSEREFLVSANRGGKFVLYLMDVDGNRELIYEGAHHVLHAQPLRPRPRPPLVPDRVAWPKREERDHPESGVVFSNDVFQGTPKGLRDEAKHLRVLTIEPKTYTYWYKRPYISTGPVVSLVQSEGVKRVLGTVPIEADGSVAFRAPAGKALHFQLLDEQYRALQTMRSFTGVMPGEYRGCLGCHESHSRAPRSDSHSSALAHGPREITPPPWGEDTVSYTRYVRPLLDQYCGDCHQGEGEARDAFDITPRPGFLGFDETYVVLTGRPSWGQPYQAPADPSPGWGIADVMMVEAYDQRDPAGYQTPPPMTGLSYRSRLVELVSSGEHHDVRVDDVSLRKLIAWIDTMCPYRGDEEVRAIPDPRFQGIDWLSVRPLIETAPRIARPGPLDD